MKAIAGLDIGKVAAALFHLGEMYLRQTQTKKRLVKNKKLYRAAPGSARASVPWIEI